MNTYPLIRRLTGGLRQSAVAILILGLMSAAAPLPRSFAAPPAELNGQALAMPAAQPAAPCEDNAQSCYGDLDATRDGAGSEDDFTTYSPPRNFLTWAENSWPPNATPGTGPRPLRHSDEPTGGNFPFVLTGHPSFDPARVRSATLRVDLLFNSARGTVASDTLRFWDEHDATGNYTLSYALGSRVAHRFCSPFGPNCPAESFPPTWISLDLNLKDGTARVFDLDPITGQRTPFSPRPGGAAGGCNAQVPVDCPWPGDPNLLPLDRGSPADVLRLAADGKLYGLLEDDSALGYISLTIDADPLPPVCTTLLDNFNRANGPLRAPWRGSEGRPNYRIANRQLDPGNGGPIFWPTVFGADQTACVTLARVDPNGVHQSLLLKIRGDWRQGAIAVFYKATTGEVGIETFVPRRGWLTLATVSIPVVDGDQLGARAMPNGKVIAYVNDAPVLETTVEPIFHNRTGQIGLWFIASAQSRLDDFSGGTAP
ncbi:MAG: hypothetical protein ACT4QE_21730 [Anaerolineales bacterium]